MLQSCTEAVSLGCHLPRQLSISVLFPDLGIPCKWCHPLFSLLARGAVLSFMRLRVEFHGTDRTDSSFTGSPISEHWGFLIFSLLPGS